MNYREERELEWITKWYPYIVFTLCCIPTYFIELWFDNYAWWNSWQATYIGKCLIIITPLFIFLTTLFYFILKFKNEIEQQKN